MSDKKIILVIDDEEGVRDAFELALEDMDYVVETAANGEEGIKKAEQNRPDLVFTDLKMPGINGVETMRRLNEHYSDLRIYVITAFYEEYMEQLRQAATEDMYFDVLRKPIGSEQIRMLVASVFDEPQFMA